MSARNARTCKVHSVDVALALADGLGVWLFNRSEWTTRPGGMELPSLHVGSADEVRRALLEHAPGHTWPASWTLRQVRVDEASR